MKSHLATGFPPRKFQTKPARRQFEWPPQSPKKNVYAVVILIDQNTHFLRAMKRAVQAMDMDVKIAGDAQKGLEIYKAEKERCGKVDLVVSSFRLHETDGLQLLREIKKCDPDARVILLAGGATAEEKKTLLEAGALEVVNRKLSKPELLQLIAENMGPG